MDYVVAVKFTNPIQRMIYDNTSWVVLDNGIEICEQLYKSDAWEMSRRIVMVRQRIKD